jgi:bacteriorhodopsin
MSYLFVRGNEALTLNPPTGTDIHLTTHGSDWMWAVFAFFGVISLSFLAGSYYRASKERLFFYSSILSAFFIAISAYTVASDLGFTSIQAEFNHEQVSNAVVVPGLRQIFYSRHVAWFLAFPPIIMNLGVYAAVPWPTLLFTLLNVEVWVVLLLIGALIHSTYKWGYFVFGVVAYLIAAWHLCYSFRKSAVEFGHNTTLTTTLTASATTLLMMLYTICWGLTEGGNVIAPDSEAVFYGILDIFQFGIVAGYFLVATRDANFEELGIISPSGPAFHRGEKEARYSEYSADTHAATVNQDAPITAPAPGPMVPENAAEQV